MKSTQHASQIVWQAKENWLVALMRTSLDQKQKILVLANMSDERHRLVLSRYTDSRFGNDLLSDNCVDSAQQVDLGPGEIVWLEAIS